MQGPGTPSSGADNHKMNQYLLGEILLHPELFHRLQKHLLTKQSLSLEDLFEEIRDFLHKSLPDEIKNNLLQRIAESFGSER